MSKYTFEQVKSFAGVEVVVLKPTYLGGIEKTWGWMKLAGQYGLQVTISSTFETDLGLYTLAQIAGCTKHQYIAGLDTLKWFKEDLLQGQLRIQKGRIHLNDKIDLAACLKSPHLKEIANA
ncbi:MAG: hypothetical protein A2Z88_10785 [Omnitrophica WOR_2 bacterium GWA2_47_8]|nr:MAG: hypothetical protein A2Z88_10785 [Omnitrophica WOR_2 bacterium GWA2_47_8]